MRAENRVHGALSDPSGYENTGMPFQADVSSEDTSCRHAKRPPLPNIRLSGAVGRS